MTTYSAKSAAIRAARVALGDAPFDVARDSAGRWAWTATFPDHEAKGRELAALEGRERDPEAVLASAGAAAGAKLESMGAKRRATPQIPPLAGMAPLGIAAPSAQKIAVEHVAGTANHFVLNAAGQAAVAKVRGKEALAAAEKGVLPTPPDFTAETHKRHRKALDELKALVEAHDIAGLEAHPVQPLSSSRVALDRYRNLAVVALKAKRVPA